MTKHREYLLSRALMRHALSEKVSQQKHSWIFVERVNSPALATVMALSALQLLAVLFGIDLEVITKQRDFPKLAQLFMDDCELAFD